MMHSNLHMPLSVVSAGREVVLRSIRGGQGVTSRLTAMGFVPGVSIEVCQNDRRGPILVGLRGGRVMLGRGMAEKMAVE